MLFKYYSINFYRLEKETTWLKKKKNSYNVPKSLILIAEITDNRPRAKHLEKGTHSRQ